MKSCWCKFAMAVLIVILAWMDVSWTKIAITVLGVIIAVMSLWGGCCCKGKCECETEKTEKK